MRLASHDENTLTQPVRDYLTRLVRRHAYAALTAAGIGWAAWTHPGITVPAALALSAYAIIASPRCEAGR
ncbi:hypothetical protein [Kibdelosporangium phytohabitans]|uniref:Uncharacterized protein n=1 Tax=Kibdelosporangium phytohabitans TaxID=860235 RepID=A0A0N9I2Z2_9PSEU|nr:hypothetical protein [Kibdelosporangium phytohabitans]ALG08850.1 hypothetical protein AOZ06_19765 [Kibdelosporangium phytohabitans]MBE1470001.1 protein-S-isoprenylcysteine O-methyltransferase Ste14 [Kibdelosporangium phytohabitans]